MITSTANPFVKELVRLRTRRHRDREGRFLIEGRREATAAAAAGLDLVAQIVAPALGGRPVDPSVETVELGDAAFRKVSMRQRPDGVMVVATALDTRLERLAPHRDSLLLIVESAEKPGNIGAILRTADAVGVDGVIVADPATDIHNPNVVRASQGALFSVDMAVAGVSELVPWLRRHGLTLAAASPAGDTSMWEVDLTGSIAIAVGAEATGLSSTLIEAAEHRLVVPMRGSVDSLNVSVTAAVLLYEAARQRR